MENFQEKSGDEVATGRLNSTNLEMSAVLRFTVPPTPPAGRGGQITLVAGTDIVQKVVGTPGQVVWIYRTEAPPPARNEAPPPATVFAGYVLAHDNQNHAFPLPDAPVRIRLELEGNVRVVNTLTNRQGLYQVAVEDVTDKTAYRVQVALAERTGVYQVLWYTDLHPATYVTAEREVGPDRGPDSAKNIVLANLLFEPRMAQGKPVRVEADGSLTDVRQRTVDEDRAAALSYARLYTAMAYGRDRLGVAYDHKLPLAVILGQESSLRSHYDPAGRIEITAEDMNIVFSGEPDNLEWHEFGHFLTQDSAWFGDNLIVLIGADDSNHAGVKNRTSQDSVLEGAAEFLVLLFKGVAARTDDQAPYMIGDYLLNLQDNKFDNYNKEFKEWVPLEEWQFAALLWDVMDQDRQPEPGDQVAWGLSRLWGVLSNVSSWTVRGHYEALKAEAGEPLPGPQDSPTALDRLFILHGFYSNTNGVAGWQQGEPIGYPDSWKPRAAPSASWGPAQHPAGVRFSPAVPQYLWLEPELPAKVPPPNIAELTVYPTDGRSPWKAPLRAAPDGRFPLLVPPGAERIQLRLLVPGFQVAPLEFTRSNYKAVIEKGAVVVRAKPEVQPSPIGSPGNFNFRREEASTVTLTWSLAKGV
ncbi:MAG: hypothetical protein U1B77_01605, partial [Dehalococcoidales bacterium]|nr:hypothetical protein [Dehalococcoidales bacterium]